MPGPGDTGATGGGTGNAPPPPPDPPPAPPNPLASARGGLNKQRGLLKMEINNATVSVKECAAGNQNEFMYAVLQEHLRKVEGQHAKVMKKYEIYLEVVPGERQEQEAETAIIALNDEYNTVKQDLIAGLGIVQKVLDARRPPETARPAATANALPKIQDSLKPKDKLHEKYTLQKWHYWRESFEAFSTSSQLDKHPILGQHTILYQLLDDSLENKLRVKAKPTTPLLGKDGMLDLLDEIFLQMNPIHIRRVNFFSSKQDKHQKYSDFLAILDQRARAADLETLDSTKLFVHVALAGCRDNTLREKILTRQEEPTMAMINNITALYESEKATQKAFDGGQPSANNARGRSKQRGRSQSKSRSKSRASSVKRPTGVCWRCGDENHLKPNCPKDPKSVTCKNCQRWGHVEKVCKNKKNDQSNRGRSKHRGGNRSQSPSPNRSGRGKFKGANASNVTTGHVARTESHSNKIGEPTPMISMQFQGKHRARNVKQTRFQCDGVVPDSGASDTILKKSVVDKAGLKIDKRYQSFITVANGQVCHIAGLVRIEGFYQGQSCLIEALVCADLEPEILLGWQDMKKLGILPANFPASIFKVQSSNRSEAEEDSNAPSCADSDDLKSGRNVVPAVNNSKQENENTSALPSEEEVAKFQEEILRDYEDVFSEKLKSEPIRDFTMKIEIHGDVKPLKVNVPREIPIHVRDPAKECMDELLAAGVVERVPAGESSAWCSPAFFILKPDGRRARLLVDMTELNKATVRSPKPFPSTASILRNIEHDATVFAKLDAVQGFFQINLAEESRPLTTFILPEGRFRFCRGVQGSSATIDAFCEAVDRAFQHHEGTQKIVDDSLTCARNLKELDQRLRAVLDDCRHYNITLSKKKFQVGTELKFAGHVVGVDGIKPDPDKVKALEEFKTPSNVSEVRSFLGLANQLGTFIPDLTHICRPMHELLKKDAAFIWDVDQEEAFQQAKMILTGDLLVKTFDPGLPLKLYTDASRRGLGYCLMQEAEHEKRLIKCGSRSLTNAEKNYAVCELEALAVYFAVKHCDFYLAGAQEVEVITDHRALIFLWQKPLPEVPNARVQRYREKLQHYNLKFTWLPGKHNAMADALSRVPMLSNQDREGEEEDDDKAMAISALTCLASLDPRFEKLLDDKDNCYDALIKLVKCYECKKDFVKTKDDENKDIQEYLTSFEDVIDRLSILGTEVGKQVVMMDGTRVVVPGPAQKRVLQ